MYWTRINWFLFSLSGSNQVLHLSDEKKNLIHMELFPAIISERTIQSIRERIGLLIVLRGGVDML